MIQLRNIKKSFFQEKILDDFSYDFNDYGFYLIYGPSGSGKSTLVNIISSYLPCDSGEIYYNGHNIRHLDKEQYNLKIAYLTQDSYFIYYLTILDNLEASGVDMHLALELIHEFSLDYVLEKYPDQLSGGEKQRISIIQALALHKAIIILDEPTSSLDEENKEKVFQFLSSIKHRVLIICVSHDETAKQYADYIIDFHNIVLYRNSFSIESPKEILEITLKDRNLYTFVKKQKKYKKREKKSIIIFTFIVIIQFIMLFLCANPETKIIKSLGNDYHLNYLNIDIPNDQLNMINEIQSSYSSIQSIVYDYKYAGNYCPSVKDGVGNCKYSIGLSYTTLPSSNSFYYYNHLKAGTYFKKSNDLILGYEYAYEMNKNVEQLIGKEMVVKTANGDELFNIVGVFEQFSENEENYFKGNYVNAINDTIYLNDKFTEKFLDDDQLSQSEQAFPKKHRFIVYFDSFDNLMQFYTDNSNKQYEDADSVYVYPISDYLSSIIRDFMKISVYLFPIIVVSSLLVIAFYVQMQIIKLQHSINIFGIYQYYGFTWSNIKKAYKKYYIFEILFALAVATIISSCLILPINFVIKYFHLFPFELLSFSPMYLMISLLILFITSLIFINLKMNKIKQFNWFELIKARRDLL